MLVKDATVYHAFHKIENFYSIEGLGIEYKPKCGGSKCGKCHPVGKSMALKEEKEYHLIDGNMKYIQEKKWGAGYPWIKDPYNLPGNKCAALTNVEM